MIRAREVARLSLVAGLLAIGAAYAAAFYPGGAPSWSAWLMALGIPAATVGIMIMGAVREGTRLGNLVVPFTIVGLLLAAGFCLALSLPANEGPASALYLGLPLRAAIIVYGVGLLPTVVLPIAYALTFETQTLSREDVERARELGSSYRNKD